MATPVDFTGMQAITALVRDGRLEPEELIDATGNVPPEAVESAFRLLKPTAEAGQYANLWQHLWNDQYMEGYQAMGQWTARSRAVPGRRLPADGGAARARQRADAHGLRRPADARCST